MICEIPETISVEMMKDILKKIQENQEVFDQHLERINSVLLEMPMWAALGCLHAIGVAIVKSASPEDKTRALQALEVSMCLTFDQAKEIATKGNGHDPRN